MSRPAGSRPGWWADVLPCQTQMKWAEVVQDCSCAVDLNPRYIKALFRRAKAQEKLDNKKECLEGQQL